MGWCGRTFLFPLNLNNKIPHLWIVITEPNDRAECLIVSITTLRYDKDQTVILNRADHPFIEKPSVVYYQDIQLTTTAKIEAQLRCGIAAPMDNCSGDLLQIVQQGLCASQYTAPKHLRFYREYVANLPKMNHGK